MCTELSAMKGGGVSKESLSVKEAATVLDVSPRWVRARIAEGRIAPSRAGGKRTGRFTMSQDDVAVLRAVAAEMADPPKPDLARIEQLEADRSNLLAQVAWERAITQEQGRALDAERSRIAALEADLALQRTRVEQLKALTPLDRLLGRHKAV